MPAALIASMVKVAFLAGVRESEDPGTILRRMNGTLCGMFERSYVTAACAVLRPDEGILTYALAGHPPPLLIPAANDPVMSLDQRGIFLGFTLAAEYITATMPIRPGARLILYSDGVTETPAPDGDLFGLERLSAFAARQRHQPCDASAEAVMGSLRNFAGKVTVPHDDVTLVIVDVTMDRPSPL